jgi:hypothetical protein
MVAPYIILSIRNSLQVGSRDRVSREGADALSRLPLKYQADASAEEHIFNISDQQLNCHPVSAKQIARETALDKVFTFTQHGWSQTCNNPLSKGAYCGAFV